LQANFKLRIACRAREQRARVGAARDEKRRKFAEDLERRERAVAQTTQEENARARLERELARIRKTRAEREAKAAAERRAAGAATTAARAPSHRQGPVGVSDDHGDIAAAAAAAERLTRTLKVSWARSDSSSKEYDAVSLKQAFKRYGTVEEVIMREGKKRKGSALIVMSAAAAAQAAAEAVCGDIANPLLVVPLAKGGQTTRAAGVAVAPHSSGQETTLQPPYATATPLGGGAECAGDYKPSKSRLPPRPSKPAFAAGAGASSKPSGTAAEPAAADGTQAQPTTFPSFSKIETTNGSETRPETADVGKVS
jgi:hypothetical protein